jgi:hypothetical protein
VTSFSTKGGESCRSKLDSPKQPNRKEFDLIDGPKTDREAYYFLCGQAWCKLGIKNDSNAVAT